MDESTLPSYDPSPPFFTTPCQDMGLDELGRLVNHIAAQVQTLVSAPPPPGTKYRDGLHSLRTAFEQGLAIIGGLFNATTPIHRLPPELLTEIFSLSPREITQGFCQDQLAYWPFKTEPDVADLHELTKVCRYWRDLAIATPTLWTTIGSLEDNRGPDPSFRCSKYLPENSSVDLTIHFDSGFVGHPEKMIDFMLLKSANIRELHVWNMARIPDVPSFLLSFDASALEHCTLWTPYTYWSSDVVRINWDEEPLPYTPFLPFFSNGGPKLRSLYLTDFHGLPTNEFPALTLLVVTSIEFESRITMEALLQFLAGCPLLEEVYLYNILRCSWHTTPAYLPPVSLPCLRYLYYTYGRRQRLEWELEERLTDPIEYLLSHTSIPSTCHMYFLAYDEDPGDQSAQAVNHDIIDSVCRHVQGKDAISHLFLWLLPEEETDNGAIWSSVQMVFSKGSLRLESQSQFDCVNLLNSYPHLFSTTEDLRVRYNCTLGRYTDLESALATSLPMTFPELKVLSLIPEDYMWMDPDLRPVHAYLTQPLLSSQPGASGSSSVTEPGYVDADEVGISVPHPGLDTLWIFVQSSEAIAPLQATISERKALGFPIRCVVVHHCFEEDSTALERLQALNAMVEELVLTNSDSRTSVPSTGTRQVDWVVGLPDMFSLPSAIRRDWPTGWYRGHIDGRDGRDTGVEMY